MFVCVPTYNRWENNPIYERVVKYAKNKARFLFFVRPNQATLYREFMPDVTIIPIGEECLNIGTTRRWIDSFMRNSGVPMYCQMDDRISSIGIVSFVGEKTQLSGKDFNRQNVDQILDWMFITVASLLKEYPQIALLSIRRRGFANSVSPDAIVDLNHSIAQIDDVLIVNTAYPLENIPMTDTFAEDANFSVSALSRGRYIGTLNGFVRHTDESFPSRCTDDESERHRIILEDLPKELDRVYRCSGWLEIAWNKKHTFPAFKILHKNSPVPRIRLSVDDLRKITEEDR